jgi:hypothetical protein
MSQRLIDSCFLFISSFYQGMIHGKRRWRRFETDTTDTVEEPKHDASYESGEHLPTMPDPTRTNRKADNSGRNSFHLGACPRLLLARLTKTIVAKYLENILRSSEIHPFVTFL